MHCIHSRTDTHEFYQFLSMQRSGQQRSTTMLAVRTGSYTFEHDPDSPVTLCSYRAKAGEENLNILEDEFSLFPGRGTPIQVKLTQNAISYEKPSTLGGDSREASIDVWDIAGTVCGRQKGRNGIISELNKASKTTDFGAYICIYAYPYNKPPLDGGVRQKRELVFRYSQESTYEKNLEVVQKWKTAIDLLLQNFEVNNISDINASRLPSRPQKLLVFINPASGRGRGRGVQVFNRDVAPILKQAGIKFEIVVTSHQNYARQKVAQMDLKDFHDGIVIVSGDGLVYEVVNGLMDREDKMKAVQTPIGVIPAGSGNAMASAILHRLGENYHKNAIQHSAFLLTKRGTHPLDLIKVQTATQEVTSFLSIAWGIIADIDIESERYRFLGAARFTFGALVRIVNLRQYRGKLRYLPVEDTSKYQTNSMTPSTHSYPVDPKDAIMIHDDDKTQREHMTRHHSVYQLQTNEVSEIPGGPRGMPRHSTVTQGLSVQEDFSFNDKFIRADLDNTECDDSGLQLNMSSSDTNNLSSSSRNSSSSSPCLTDSGDSNNAKLETLLPPLSEPVPSNWAVLEGDFVGIVITYMSHLSQDVMAWPNREFDEGCLSVQYLKCPTPRKNLLDLMEAFTDGSHIEKGCIQVLYAKAIRLEPITENGILTIDGENIEYGPIQAEVIPNLKGSILIPPFR